MVITVQAPFPHWLACVKHSVSVHPEPGSNSSFNIYFHLLKSYWQELFIIKSPYLSHLLWYMLLLFICLLYMIHFRIDKRYYIKNKKDCQLLFFIFFNNFYFSRFFILQPFFLIFLYKQQLLQSNFHENSHFPKLLLLRLLFHQENTLHLLTVQDVFLFQEAF